MFMRTPRLFLRPAWPEDHAEHGCAFHVSALHPGAGTRHPRFPHWLVTRPDSSGGAASIGQVWLENAGADAEVRCHISPIQRRRGYGAEALRGVAGIAQMLGHPRLCATVRDDDHGIGRMLARAGFRRAGTGRWHLNLACGGDSPETLGTAA